MFVPADPSNRRGIVMMLCACALIAATTLIAKWLGTGAGALHPLQVASGRFVFALMALLGLCAVLRPRLHAPNIPLHLARVTAGWGGVTLMFAAVTLIPVADATAITYLNPVFGMILAVVLLGERAGPWRWAAGAVALLGAVILLRPGAGSLQVGALVALGAAVMMGVEITILKRLSGAEPPLQILLFSNGIGAVIAVSAALPVWVPPAPQQWAGLAALGCVMVSAQALFIQAMRAADASFVLPFSYATLIFAATYDRVIFGAAPDAVSLAGIAVILTGAGVLAWREGRARARPDLAATAPNGVERFDQ